MILLGRRLGMALGAAAALLLAGAVWHLSRRGVDFVWIKRLNLVIALAAAGVLTLRAGVISKAGTDRVTRWVITALALLAVVSYLNFFSFHGERTWVHLHDVAHYYLGSKYYGELGYADLYTAMLRAEAETHGSRFKTTTARDLESYDQVHIRALLRRSDEVKEAFSDDRWEAFKADVDYFRERLGPLYNAVLLDHGFNPTPVWALMGGALANLVPAGSHAGILLLTLIDPVLILAALGLVAWAFGPGTAILALLHFCIIFGATFGWTGGAFMRYPWFLGVVASVCLLKKRRHSAAGAALAVAAALRVFPLFFALPVLLKGAALWLARCRRRGLPGAVRPPRRYAGYAGGLGGGLLVLLAATSMPPAGAGHWESFGRNLATHVETISPNMVGLTEPLAFRPGAGKVTQEEFRQLKSRRQRITAAQILLAFIPVLVLCAVAAPRLTDWSASALLTLPLMYAGVSLASYYYVILVLLVAAWRSRPRLLAAVFAVEAVPYAVMLVERRDAVLYIVRGLALAPLLAFILMAPARRQWARLAREAGGGPGPARAHGADPSRHPRARGRDGAGRAL